VTGPEHYTEAERLLDHAENEARGGHDHSEAMALANAQVHATLALAAATALYDGDLDRGADIEYQAWRKTAGSEVTP